MTRDIVPSAVQELDYWRHGQEAAQYFQADVGSDIQRRVDFLREVIAPLGPLPKILEAGSGTGANLAALWQLCPEARIVGVEPSEAARRLSKKRLFTARVHAMDGEIERLYEVVGPCVADLVLVHGVLVHVPHASRPQAYREIARASKRFVLLVEYEPYSQHGHAIPTEHCWPADFGLEFLEAEPKDFALRLKRDGPQDGTTAWLLERHD